MDAPLNFDRHSNAKPVQDESADLFNISELVEQLSGFVRRQLPIFLFIVPCSIALGLVYLLTASPHYTAHATLLIDSSKPRILQQQQASIGEVPIDTAQVETQVEILKSENIGLAVIKDLKLTADPEFVGSSGGLLGKIMAFFSEPKPQSEAQLTREALRTFESRRSIARIGRTYVLDISFTSISPNSAANVANTVADAYIVDQLDAKYQATRRASVWLQDRIKELRQQASEADRAVLDYKEKNNIISLSGGNSSNGSTTGKLLGEQQLEELNTQLGAARAAAEEVKARLDRINEVMSKDVPDATVADSLHNEVINRLRNNYLDLSAKEAIWSARYGSGHLAAVNLRTQMAELRRSILDELGRIQQGYKSDYEIAKTRVEGLEHNLEGLVANSQVVNRDRLGLRDLESTAQVYHTIYDNFLQRYMEAIQQQSFPITEARVISVAAAPRQKSGPLSYVVLGTACFIGLVLSFGAAILREAVDRVFRTTRQVENTLQAHCIAVLPMLAPRIKPVGGVPVKSAVSRRAASSQDIPADKAALAVGLAPVASADAVSAFTSTRVMRPIARKKAFMNEVIDEPLSAFTEAFRGIKVAADISGRDNKVIGITSTLPAEGKSTVASNLAQLIAHGGNRVILLDGDLRNPSATRAMAPDAKAGVFEVINGQIPLESGLYTDEVTGLRFLPAVMESRVLHTNEVLASAAFRNLVENLRKTYDYVIIDFPPLAPVVDVRATTQIVDSYVYVVEWGKTRVNLVQDRLLGCPEIHERLLGVVLNKANVNVLERYESYYGKYYYRRHYGDRYGYSA
jgi:succinoglycan biosynthesis transport protein ExoP